MEIAVVTTYEHITLDQEGVPIVAGMRLTVADLAVEHVEWGWSAEEIAYQHPPLTLGQVYSALAYYWDHKTDIDAYLDESDGSTSPAVQFADISTFGRSSCPARQSIMLKLCFDHNMQRQIASRLRLRDVDVVTAYEDGTHTLGDPEVLNRSSALGRLLVTKDHHFLAIAQARLGNRATFTGIVYVFRESISIGECIEQLELVAKIYEYEETVNSVLYLPL